MLLHDTRQAEVTAKVAQVRSLLHTRHLDALELNQIPNVAWLTAGAATYVNTATEASVASVIVTNDDALLITDTIETPRLRDEEGVGDLGLTVITEPWYARGGTAAQQLAGKRIWSDTGGTAQEADLTAALRDLRTQLTTNEVARFREVGALAAAAMAEAIRQVRPGMTEYEAAALLDSATRVRGAVPIVNLVASDERIARYRHPLPSSKVIDRYVMLVLCARRAGLVASVTRLAHFGPLPEDLQRRAAAVARVDARMILGTQPGRTLGEMFALARTAYADEGYPEAIAEHHQGGSAGYQTREALARPEDPTLIAIHQAFAWNPSVRGVKSEDTIILGPDGPEVVTAIEGWPVDEIISDGQTIARPAILER